MSTLALNRKILLSTATLLGALSGYGRSAYSACAPGAPPNFVCSGANVVQQNINLDNASVTTDAGFSVNTGNAIGVAITGDGALSYTDANASSITAATTALSITSGGDSGGTPGSITVDTAGTLTGGDNGILAANSGTGAVNITANGAVTGTTAAGISASNSAAGTDLAVTIGAGSTITGVTFGILADNAGSGAVTVNVGGYVGSNGPVYNALEARNSANGTDITITTAAGSEVTSNNRMGIRHQLRQRHDDHYCQWRGHRESRRHLCAALRDRSQYNHRHRLIGLRQRRRHCVPK